MPAHSSVGAVVLCGGRSERMGTDKSLLLIEGRPFLSHICSVINSHFQQTVVVAADGQRLPELPGNVSIVRDSLPNAGPLAGLLTGLERSADQCPELTRIWLGCCDAPFVNLPVIDRLLAADCDSDAVVVQHEDCVQPFGGVYRTGIQEVVASLVERGDRRLSSLPGALRTRIIDSGTLRDLDPELEFLRNVNTQQDYEQYVMLR
ncbi:MAG: molybdenum cofactor guanylyltransferase [Fuerstiella sp.]|nr:molybdenum cofactor guanylyltransferase [Fuerstiella sp.]